MYSGIKLRPFLPIDSAKILQYVHCGCLCTVCIAKVAAMIILLTAFSQQRENPVTIEEYHCHQMVVIKDSALWHPLNYENNIANPSVAYVRKNYTE